MEQQRMESEAARKAAEERQVHVCLQQNGLSTKSKIDHFTLDLVDSSIVTLK
jgi:hypothetical protein